MGYVTVRRTLTEALNNPPIPGLSNVFKAEPIEEFPVQGWDTQTPRTLAWAFIHLERSEDLRASFPRGGGFRNVVYIVTLGVSANTRGTFDDATDDHDELMDAIKSRLLTMASVPPILAIAEGEHPIDIRTPIPLREGNIVILYTEIRFPVEEMNQA